MTDFVNCPYRHGEMSPSERKALYGWISDIKPRNILEVGTGNGGSTYYMAKAIKDSGVNCSLYTCDPRREPVKEFFKEFPFVHYYRVVSNILMAYLRSSFVEVNFAFFDGPDDSKVALRDFIVLDKTYKKDIYFSMHDWECVKASKIRPYIEKLKHWEKVEILDGNMDSVGLCLYKKV
jgi:hypothetical protein